MNIQFPTAYHSRPEAKDEADYPGCTGLRFRLGLRLCDSRVASHPRCCAISSMCSVRRTQLHLWIAGRRRSRSGSRHTLADREWNGSRKRAAPHRYTGKNSRQSVHIRCVDSSSGQKEIRGLSGRARTEKGCVARPESAVRAGLPIYVVRHESRRTRIHRGVRGGRPRRQAVGCVDRMCADAREACRKQRRRIPRRDARRDCPHAARQNISGCVGRKEHRCRVDVDSRLEGLPHAGRNRTSRQ